MLMLSPKNCKTHIDKLANKISKTMGVLNKLTNLIIMLPLMQARMIIYNSLILSHLKYCIIACMGLQM